MAATKVVAGYSTTYVGVLCSALDGGTGHGGVRDARQSLRMCYILRASRSEQTRRLAMRWYVSRNGETVGPVDWATLYEWRNRGWISPDMYLWAEGGNAWVPVEQTPVRALMRSNAASDGA